MLYKDKTDKILKAFYKVYNKLGFGFLEKVYQNALVIELTEMGFDCKTEYPITVFYDIYEVGLYKADIIVNNCLIIEVKASEGLSKENEYQLINYLKATEIEIGLLLNFGKSPEFRRKIFSNKLNEFIKENTDNAD